MITIKGACIRRMFKKGALKHVCENKKVLTTSGLSMKNESAELSSAKPFEEMPKLPMLPFIGSGWLYLPFIGKYKIKKMHLGDWEKYETYGKILRERIGSLEIVNSFDPETMETFFRQEGEYPTRGGLTSLAAYRNSRKEWYKRKGMLESEGKEWRDLRSKIQAHFLKPSSALSHLDLMQDIARDMITLIQNKKGINNEVPEFLSDLYKWALESVACIGLDTRLNCLQSNLSPDSDGQKMISAVQQLFYCMYRLEFFKHWQYVSTPTWRKFCKSSDIFTEIAFKYINRSLESLKENSKEEKEPSFLQNLLLTKDLDSHGAMVTIVDMMMGGIDTTSHFVGFLLYHLAKNPDKQEAAFEEIRSLLPQKEDRITKKNFNEFRYIKACLKESMRLNPIFRGNIRTFDHDIVISGYRVPAGTLVFCLLQVIFRDEKYFKDPDSYLPGRWLDKESKQTNPFTFTPFGIGPRICIGKRLVELEVVCLAVEVIRNFKLEYHYEDIDMITRLTNIPDKPLRISFVER